VITAAGLADALPAAFAELQPGAERSIVGLELVEPGDEVLLEPGDLVVLLGARSEDEVLEVVGRAATVSGLVLRQHLASSSVVRERCRSADLPLLVVPDDAPWSWVLSLLRTAVDRPAALVSQRAVDVHGDLFEMADHVSGIVGGPVTIEDAGSRVLAYSTGQHQVDQARTSTIVGRQVPREVRAHFRALGVFRRLATSDEPFLVPGKEAGVRARYVVPVRAGGEWLGSIWAVVDEPVAAARQAELAAAVQVVALYLLRLRAQSELHRQVQLDSIRQLLRGAGTQRPDWLEEGTWRVAVLLGPDDLAAEDRCEVWQSLSRRHGWRQPLVADLDGTVYAVLRSRDDGPGGWPWLCRIVEQESSRQDGARALAGSGAEGVAGLLASRALADELAGLDPSGAGPCDAVEQRWADLVVARARRGLADAPLVSPVAVLRDEQHAALRATLAAVIDFWGEPQRAAARMGVHVNTVRYRMARLREVCDVDLDDPRQRLAVRLELDALDGS
jgi:hypothetical protein